MDLEPFTRINPCGHSDLEVTQLMDLDVPLNTAEVGEKLAAVLAQHLAPSQSSPVYRYG
jgi:lipoyl(octanoyl) transferase